MLWYFFCFPKPCFRLVLTVLVWNLSYCWIECTFGGIQYLLCVVYDTPLIHTNDLFPCNLWICVGLKTPQPILRLIVQKNCPCYDLSQQNSSPAKIPKPLPQILSQNLEGQFHLVQRILVTEKLLTKCKCTTSSEAWLWRGLMRYTAKIVAFCQKSLPTHALNKFAQFNNHSC